MFKNYFYTYKNKYNSTCNFCLCFVFCAENISDKYACKEVLTMWAAFRRSGRIPEGDAIRFRTRFAPYFAEFTSDEHPADGQYLEDIESERPSVQAQARELWLRTENLWTLFPDFIAALRR